MRVVPSRRTDYALQAMIYLAGADGRRVPAPEIAERMELSVNYLRQVLGVLTRAHLVASSPSSTGGYTLARPPDNISVLEIVEVMEGALVPADCVLRGGPCYWEDVCPMHSIWSGALQALAKHLAAGTLAALAADDRALAQRQLPIPGDAHRRHKRPAGP